MKNKHPFALAFDQAMREHLPYFAREIWEEYLFDNKNQCDPDCVKQYFDYFKGDIIEEHDNAKKIFGDKING